MDYGKLAYLKAVDLEDRLNLSKKENFNVNLIEITQLPVGRHTVATVQGRGDIAVFAQCSLPATFYVDDVEICQGDKVFFKVSDGGKIVVETKSDLNDLRFMALGDITATERVGTGYADYNDESLCYLICDKGKGVAYITGLNAFAPIKIYESSCSQGDVCAFGDGFVMALVDSVGTIKTVSTKGEEFEYFLGADRVAIDSDDFTICVSFVKRGELYYFEINKIGDPLPELEKVAYNGYVDDVRFVRKGSKLLFSSGGKCFVKEIGNRGENKDKLYVNLLAEVSK